MEVNIKDFITLGSIVGIVNFNGDFSKLKNNKRISYITNRPYKQNSSLKKFLSKNYPSISSKKIEDAFRMVDLANDLLDSNLINLSSTEVKKFRFVEALLMNSETLVFVDFSNGFYEKDCNYFKKLFIKLTKYNKCVMVFTQNIEFLFGLIHQFYLFGKNNKYVLLNDFYDNRIYECVDEPEIISFIKFLEQKHISLEHYIEVKELLKGIYRNVMAGEK